MFFLQLLGWTINLFFVFLLILVTTTLIKEKETDRLVRVILPGSALIILLTGLLILTSYYNYNLIVLVVLGVLEFVLVGVGILLFPPRFLLKRSNAPAFSIPSNMNQIDERDIMFARVTYQAGDGRYEEYYSRHPERQEFDDSLKGLPGLCSPKTAAYNEVAAAVTKGNFQFLSDIGFLAEGSPAEDPVEFKTMTFDEEQMTRSVKELAHYFGAELVGITKLHPYHLYSHRGRQPENYGQPVQLKHQFAIAFAVEMNYEMVKNAPHIPVVAESSQQYVKASIIGMQLSYYIRQLGYEARNHMDGNYLVVAPLVAADAGLGEIGRMGILMTERFGPRVRLGVVTTNLPLIPDNPINLGLSDFCLYCEKCARECPGRCIPHGPQQTVNGVERWQINQEYCFSIWNRVGTDCAVCMNACPYSKPDYLLHKLTRYSLRHSQMSRQIFPLVEDYLYSKRPHKKITPRWM